MPKRSRRGWRGPPATSSRSRTTLHEGRIDGAPALQRAADCLDEQGRFRHARFELDEAGVIKHFDEHSWAWNDNPFVGTRELNGLKIVMMWLSNWDAKDVRDVARGSNTAIFEYPGRHGFREARYLIIDWGGALGRWGSIVAPRTLGLSRVCRRKPGVCRSVSKATSFGSDIRGNGPRISHAGSASPMPDG